ncbi:MAG TPA: FkbM family methyltransferase [Terriglobales bacterium]|nr:FkbM family methyltransferase [Terriglobales bacterium]
MIAAGTDGNPTMNGLRHSYQRIRRIVHVLGGKDLWRSVQHNCTKLSLGSEGARWCICPDDFSKTSVVYSVGVGEEISFDLELMRRFGTRVHAFDPTPRSIQWVQSKTLPDGFVFHAYGVADFDGTCRFLPPKDPRHVSYTVLPRHTPGPAVQAPVYRLSTIMKMLGHSEIDLLKMDIEGAEYDVLADLLACKIRPQQILVEFHHRWPEVGSKKTRAAIRALNCAGYRIFHVSPSGEEYSFRIRS